MVAGQLILGVPLEDVQHLAGHGNRVSGGALRKRVCSNEEGRSKAFQYLARQSSMQGTGVLRPIAGAGHAEYDGDRLGNFGSDEGS